MSASGLGRRLSLRAGAAALSIGQLAYVFLSFVLCLTVVTCMVATIAPGWTFFASFAQLLAGAGVLAAWAIVKGFRLWGGGPDQAPDDLARRCLRGGD